ncbi:hypothetical protein [Nocardia otitidiscaviarum]|uniref:hypothetical protein n=1 Tax=Nocardia otitidiscaviarum TaxID=1823 RepID=UPI002458AA9E|nr:hypothetical protein [Nocardia otitidiscaviarum]
MTEKVYIDAIKRLKDTAPEWENAARFLGSAGKLIEQVNINENDAGPFFSKIYAQYMKPGSQEPSLPAFVDGLLRDGAQYCLQIAATLRQAHDDYTGVEELGSRTFTNLGS